MPGRGLVDGDGGPGLPDDAPDEEPVVADRPSLGHLGHTQVKVHPVAGAENMNEEINTMKSFGKNEFS